ncbi:MAG: copper chaperone PCu(A)C [Rhodanobacteraceae bacterium]
MMTLRNLIAGVLIAVSSAAFAATPAPSGVHVEHPWIRWLPANLPAAGYAQIVNDGDATVRLVSADSPVYGKVMLHRSRLAEGDSTMVAVAHLDIPAHASVKLSPGGYHLMLSHARHPIKPGDKVPMTLHFANGASLQVDFSVLPANAVGPASASR